MGIRFIVTFTACMLLASFVNADTVTLDVFQRGQVSGSTVLAGASTASYAVGNVSPSAFQNYFVFDLHGINGTITAATLNLFNPANGFATNSTSETLELIAGNTDASGNFVLGGSSSYGGRTYTAADANALTAIDLGPKGINGANDSRGAYFGILGRISTLDTDLGTNEYIFQNSAGTPASNVQLVLTVVPEPGTLSLLGIAVAPTLLRPRQRNARKLT
jgi:hypothetical protein